MPSALGIVTHEKYVEWQAPPREAAGTYRRGWFDELTQNGERFVQAQPGTKNIQKNIRLLMGLGQDRDLESNLLQPDIRTFVETITDLRQIATMGSRAAQFKKNVALYNDVFRFVFWDSNFVWNTRKALQYAMMSRGYIWPKYSRDHYGWGRGRMHFDWLGPLEGLPEQVPANNDVQGCYAFTIIRPMPIAEAHARFPQFQQWLVPMSRYDWKSYGTIGMARRMDFYDYWRFAEEKDWDNKYCMIRYHWIRDLRINETGYTQQMGVDGTTWGYKVPSKGDLIVTINPENGLPQSHKATLEECRMYPQLRLSITSPSVPIPMYDDTAFDWHGEIPAVQYDVNDWAWSPIGYSAVDSVAGLEVARRDRLSDVNSVLAIRKDPPLGHDVSTGVARTQMEKLDLLHAKGVRVGGKGDPSKWTKSLLPPEIDIDDKDFKGIELLSSSIKAALGLTDLASLREMKGNLSDQSFDKFIENLGPMAKGIAVNMWMANSKHAHMLKYNIAQYFSVHDLMSMVGPEGVGLETFDNDPNSLVPSHLPGEDTNSPSRYLKMQRARWFCDQLRVVNTPAQLLNITHMQERMTYMFFLQKGVPISMSTIMSKLGVDDYDIEQLKWRQEQLNQELWKLEASAAVQSKMKELGIEPQPPQGPGQGKGGGRPSSGKTQHHAEMKGSRSGNVRVVNSTS
jgi:hypothetical protein